MSQANDSRALIPSRRTLLATGAFAALPAAAVAAHASPNVSAIVAFLRNDADCLVAVHEDRQEIADWLEGLAAVPQPTPLDKLPPWELEPPAEAEIAARAENADPVFAALADHRAAYDARKALSASEPGIDCDLIPGWEEVDDAEMETWRAVTEIVPTTLAGAAALAKAAAEYPDLFSLAACDGVAQVVESLAVGLAAIARDASA